MAELKLVIGSKTYSSWSLRPWLLLRYHNVAFREIPITLNQPDTAQRIAEFSPSGKVPVLLNGPEKVWDSLAICEYAAETLKLSAAWPSDTTLKYQARSLACEMHSGFTALRHELPMDCRRPPSPHSYSEAAASDIARIRKIWRECRQANGKNGDWLFGKFGIVDAMYAPVALRFHSYAVPLDGPERDYLASVLNLPAMREWLGAAMLEQFAAAAPAPAAAAPAPTPAPAPKAAPPPSSDKTVVVPKSSTLAVPQAAPAPAAAPSPPSPAGSSAGSAGGVKVVSNQGGVRVVSNIIPD